MSTNLLNPPLPRAHKDQISAQKTNKCRILKIAREPLCRVRKLLQNKHLAGKVRFDTFVILVISMNWWWMKWVYRILNTSARKKRECKHRPSLFQLHRAWPKGTSTAKRGWTSSTRPKIPTTSFGSFSHACSFLRRLRRRRLDPTLVLTSG